MGSQPEIVSRTTNLPSKRVKIIIATYLGCVLYWTFYLYDAYANNDGVTLRLTEFYAWSLRLMPLNAESNGIAAQPLDFYLDESVSISITISLIIGSCTFIAGRELWRTYKAGKSSFSASLIVLCLALIFANSRLLLWNIS